MSEQKPTVKTPLLKLVNDSGTSKGKNFYRIGKRGKVKHLIMGAELLAVSSLAIENSFFSLERSQPEDTAWLQIAEEENCYLIGRMAQQYRATTSIKKLKYELIVPKVLATIGAIATKEKLPQEFGLELALLLPYGEFQNHRQLKSQLEAAVANFSFQGKSYHLNLNLCECYPEGYGVSLAHLRSQPVECDYQN